MFLSLGIVSLVLPSGSIAQTTVPPKNRPAISTENDQRFLLTLVKTALVAVNQGNLTGNYTVLRDLGNTQFRQKNTSADLGVIFASFRQTKLDFGVIVEYTPVFNQPPTISERNTVRAIGYFPTNPIIEFNIVFQLENNRYGIDSISVAVRRNP